MDSLGSTLSIGLPSIYPAGTPTPTRALTLAEVRKLTSAALAGDLSRVQQLLALGILDIADRGEVVRNAATRGYLEVIKELLKDGAVISEEDRGQAVRNAAVNGHLEVVKELLKDGAVIPTAKRGEAVMNAAVYGQLEIIKELLKDGAVISEEDRRQAVMNAAVYGQLEVVKELLKDRAVISEGYRGQAVGYAAGNGHLAILRELLKDGAISEGDRGQAVINAAVNGHLEVVKELLKDGAVISEEDRGQAVGYAAVNGHLEVVKELLKDGAVISEGHRGEAVVNALLTAHLEVVKELLKDGAVISEGHRGEAVRNAATRGYLEVVKELLKDGAVISEGYRGEAVGYAAERGHLEVVKELLKDGAVIPTAKRGEAVRNAAVNGHLEVVKELLKDGAVISEGYRSVAVANAAARGHLEIIKELLKDGAISEGDRGEAVRNAAFNGHLEIVKELLKDGAVISEKDRGKAVMNAAARGYLEIIKELLKDGAVISGRDWELAIKEAKARGHSEIERELLKNTPSEFFLNKQYMFSPEAYVLSSSTGASISVMEKKPVGELQTGYIALFNSIPADCAAMLTDDGTPVTKEFLIEKFKRIMRAIETDEKGILAIPQEDTARSAYYDHLQRRLSFILQKLDEKLVRDASGAITGFKGDNAEEQQANKLLVIEALNSLGIAGNHCGSRWSQESVRVSQYLGNEAVLTIKDRLVQLCSIYRLGIVEKMFLEDLHGLGWFLKHNGEMFKIPGYEGADETMTTWQEKYYTGDVADPVLAALDFESRNKISGYLAAIKSEYDSNEGFRKMVNDYLMFTSPMMEIDPKKVEAEIAPFLSMEKFGVLIERIQKLANHEPVDFGTSKELVVLARIASIVDKGLVAGAAPEDIMDIINKGIENLEGLPANSAEFPIGEVKGMIKESPVMQEVIKRYIATKNQAALFRGLLTEWGKTTLAIEVVQAICTEALSKGIAPISVTNEDITGMITSLMAGGDSSLDKIASGLKECFIKGASRDLIQQLTEEVAEHPEEMKKALFVMFEKLGIVQKIGESIT